MKDPIAWSEMLQKYRAEFPTVSVRPYEDSWFFRTLMRFGWKFGATTVWKTIYMDKDLIETQRGIDIMAHEMVHVRDGHRWHILFAISYWLLPIGPSFKALWEWRAYKVDLTRVWREWRDDPVRGPAVIDGYKSWVAGLFTGPKYAWMLPFPSLVNRMIDRFVSSLR